MMKDADFEEASEQFMIWLKSVPDVDISPKIALYDYTEQNSGRGLVATTPIDADEQLFSIPRHALLSWQNSALKTHLALDEETLASLGDWNLLILAMLYENQRADSAWSQYFRILPHHFSTPMFWSAQEVEELQASSLRDKIGREEADQVYAETILPILHRHSQLFDINQCGLDQFHRMGSLIMAYSFDSPVDTVAARRDQDDTNNAHDDDDDDDNDDEEEEERYEKVMCPLSDLLNADTRLNNARLFHTPNALVMRSTTRIEERDQIYNTYGDLPNTDLLRRYGYVQVENEFDIVEIPGDNVTDAVKQISSVGTGGVGEEEGEREQEHLRRIDWLLDLGILDDAFEVTRDGKVPKPVLVTLLVLLSGPAEFASMQAEDEPPRALKTSRVKHLVHGILTAQLSRYSTSLENDEQLLTDAEMNYNMRNAVIVRAAEKTILHRAIELVNEWDVVDIQSDMTRKRAATAMAMQSNVSNKRSKKM